MQFQDVLVLIQARLNSNRYPRKILERIGPLTMLQHVTSRANLLGYPVVVAMARMTQEDGNEVRSGLPQHHQAHSMSVSDPNVAEDNVLARFATIARYKPCKAIVRLTADCPFIDPELIKEAIDIYAKGEYNFVTLGPAWPDGLDFEVFSKGMLMDAYNRAKLPSDREHVTPFIWRGETEPKAKQYFMPCPRDLRHHKWSVDTPDDMLFAQAVYHLSRGATNWQSIANCLEHPIFGNLGAYSTSHKRNEAYMADIGESGKDWLATRYIQNNATTP